MVVSFSLLIASKALNISVPFFFKSLVDGVAVTAALATAEVGAASEAIIAASAAAASASPLAALTPTLLIVAYGVARSTSAGFSELKNAIFSTVAQSAIRQVSRNIFEHLHRLDMQFHMDRNTGELARTIDRGTRSINFALTVSLLMVVAT